MYPTILEQLDSRLGTISSYVPAVKTQSVIALALIANLSIAPAASPSIGVAVTRGAFHLDAASVAGNGTLFDGSTIETRTATSELKLHNGVQMVLDAGTRSRVYRDHLLLERGAGEMRGANYRIRARSLEIESASPESLAKVSMIEGNRVLVAALNGPVRVRNSEGAVLADLRAGRAIELEPLSASKQSTVVGALEKSGGRYLLEDDLAGVRFEVRGPGLEKSLGRVVEVSGSTEKSANGAPVLYASNVRPYVATYEESEQGSGAGVPPDKKASNRGPAKVRKFGKAQRILLGVGITGAAAGSTIALTRNSKTNISH